MQAQASDVLGSLFETMLDRMAQVAVREGVNLAAGQELVITAPVEALPLVRRIVRHAYAAGASLVTPLFEDEQALLLRFHHASEQSFDCTNGWLWEAVAKAGRSGAARLLIWGQSPTLLAGQDQDRLARYNRARLRSYFPAQQMISNFEINWCLVPYPTVGWARAVFPGQPDEVAIERLSEALMATARLDGFDPLQTWRLQAQSLQERTRRLNAKRYAALRFSGPSTDLTVGLAESHCWRGGSTVSRNGISCIPNIPTDEVYTAPHRNRVDGRVRCTKPLAYQGSLIDGIELEFRNGRAIAARSRIGNELLSSLLQTDDGASRLGEVALVAHDAPVSKSGLLFYHTLLDENAASHIAFGKAYSTCVDAAKLRETGAEALGLNDSLIHTDLMIGSQLVDVDGLDADGHAEPVMRGGAWCQ